MQFSLGDFFKVIYGESVGFMYVATKEPGGEFSQEFYEYPNEVGRAVSFIKENAPNREVYYAPALFADRRATKENVSESRVVWVEFDGNCPEDIGDFPEPSIRIRSSGDKHEHWYWLLDSPIDAEYIERINRGITYQFSADTSGWDANQILRPPGTFNHKRGKPVKIAHLDTHNVLSLGSFGNLPEPPPVESLPEFDSLPALTEILHDRSIPTEPWGLFQGGVQVGDRSAGLMKLGYYLAELGLTNAEIYVLLEDADRRWGKFHGRSDKQRRLLEIVTIARQKYPREFSSTNTKFESIGFLTLTKLKVNIEWVLEGFLQKNGYMLVTGPSGTGKTQFAMSMAANMALGRDFLDKKVTRPYRIGLWSLEMGLEDVKYFAETQSGAFTQEELEKLEENFRIFPLGEPLYLSDDETRKQLEEVVAREKLDGIIVDSLGSVTDESLSDETAVKKLMNWNDVFRKNYNCFTVYIHHHRKATNDNSKPKKLDDVFGSQYITARATTVVGLWPTKSTSQVEALMLKLRLMKKPDNFRMDRDTHLQFTRSNVDTDKMVDSLAQFAKLTNLTGEEIDLETLNPAAPKTTKPGEGTIGM